MKVGDSMNPVKNDIKIKLDSILLGYYIKYDRLEELVKYSFQNVESNHLDIYIDLYDMLKGVYGREIYSDKQFSIVSCVINLAAHYRSYFWTRHRVTTRIFLVYGDCTLDSHKQFYPSFGDDSFRELLGYTNTLELVVGQLNMIKILCAYINEVYYVERKSNFALFAYSHIKQNPTIPSLVITKSKYSYQIPSMCSNVILFRPKKLNREDVSYPVLHQEVLMQNYNKIKTESTLGRLALINPELLSVMFTLTGLQSYGVKALCNVSAAAKMVSDAITEMRIQNAYNSDADYIYNSLRDIEKFCDPTSFKFRFNAIDLEFQYKLYAASPENIDVSWFINLNDPKTIQDINNKYFVNNPLYLDSL
jgi:hypothetical protein